LVQRGRDLAAHAVPKEHRRADEVEVVLLPDVPRVVRSAHAQVGTELDDPLAVARVLTEALARVRAALEGVPGHGVQRVAGGAVRKAAPPPDSAAAPEALRHDLPLRDH